MLDASIPLFRLEDTGMGLQMQEYAVSRVLHWFRRFDDYQALKNQALWKPLPEYTREEFSVGIMGAGYWAQKWQKVYRRGGSRYVAGVVAANLAGVESYVGREELRAFLNQTRVLINLLPNTAQTVGIINSELLDQLPDGAYVLNLARGVHVQEADLLAALDSGKLKGAMLDVFSREPLPQESPLWRHPRVAMTPHIAAVTRPAEAIDYISRTITQLEKGEPVTGQVDRARGY